MTDNINENEVKVEQPENVQAPKTLKEADVNAVSKKQLAGKIISQIVLYVFLTVMAVIVVFPFYWMLMSSVKTRAEYDLLVPTFWPTMGFRFSTYKEAFAQINFGKVFLNTMIVGVVSTILSLLITILTAYAFARFNFWGKNALFAGMLATMMIPGELFTITNYITVVADFGWADSAPGIFAAFIIPFLVSVFYIYLLRQNFMQIPNELYLAAKVDGTSDFKYLWKVMVPLSAPTLISITILKMMGAWNTYIWPALIVDEGSPFELMTVALRRANWGEIGAIDYPMQMAAVVIATVPLLIIFLLFRKYIIRGVSRSGTKG